MLRVLDPEAPVARTVVASDALVNIEQRRIRAIADRVHQDVQSGPVGAGNPALEVPGRVDEQAAIPRRIGEWLVKCRGMRAERPVHEPLERAKSQRRVAASVGAETPRGYDIAQLLP